MTLGVAGYGALCGRSYKQRSLYQIVSSNGLGYGGVKRQAHGVDLSAPQALQEGARA